MLSADVEYKTHFSITFQIYCSFLCASKNGYAPWGAYTVVTSTSFMFLTKLVSKASYKHSLVSPIYCEVSRTLQ